MDPSFGALFLSLFVPPSSLFLTWTTWPTNTSDWSGSSRTWTCSSWATVQPSPPLSPLGTCRAWPGRTSPSATWFSFEQRWLDPGFKSFQIGDFFQYYSSISSNLFGASAPSNGEKIKRCLAALTSFNLRVFEQIRSLACGTSAQIVLSLWSKSSTKK